MHLVIWNPYKSNNRNVHDIKCYFPISHNQKFWLVYKNPIILDVQFDRVSSYPICSQPQGKQVVYRVRNTVVSNDVWVSNVKLLCDWDRD